MGFTVCFGNVAAAAAKSLQSCPTLSDPMTCSLPGSSVHGIFQARVLEWVAIAFSMHNPAQPLLPSPHFDFSAIQKPHKLISHFSLHPTSGPYSSSSASILLLTHSSYLPLLWRSCPHLPCSFLFILPPSYIPDPNRL